jgi:twinkle protein
VLVLDPLNRIESDYGTMSETTYIGKLLDRLTEFAQRNNVLVILVAHPRKVQDETGKPRVPSMYDIKGSSTFYDKADYGVIVHRNKDEENEDKNYTLVKIEKVKFRHLGDKGQCFFKFFTQNGRYIPYDLENPKLGLYWDCRNYLDEKPFEMKEPNNQDKELLQKINEFEQGFNSEVPF